MPIANIAFVTLGCAKNEVDTDKMAARLSNAGFRVIEDVSQADLVVVNTCSFLVSAVDESLDTIFDVAEELELAGKGGKLLVAGCMPSRYGEDLEEELSEADAFLAAGEEEDIVSKACEVLGIDDKGLPAHMKAYAPIRSQVGTSAYVKISDGCSRFCTYCMIPYIRGPYFSYPSQSILEEVQELVERGVKEIVLIGQDTGIWGKDLDEGFGLAGLLELCATRFPDTWFRVLYLQPAGITDELLETMNAHDNICSYLDIPLQHCSLPVLKNMNRKGSAAEYLALLERIRKTVPDIVLRTTLMAGFPKESEEDFDEMLDFVDEARFDLAVVFAYSAEEGSAAAQYSGQVSDDVKLERAQRLLDACDAIGHKVNERHIGTVKRVLIEGYEMTDIGVEAVGRHEGQSPEVDGQVHIPLDYEGQIEVGAFVDVRITDAFCYDLEGELAS